MYSWQYNEVGPLHNIRFFSNQLLDWYDTDSEDLYNQNLQSFHTKQLLEKNEWLNTKIKYRFNHQGFRDYDFDDRQCALALGCSFTQGNGLPDQSIWNRILGKYLNLHIWNLGIAGGTIQTVFRILEYYIDKLSPKAVFVLVPPVARLEWCDLHGLYRRIMPSSFDQNNIFMKDWIGNETNHQHNDFVYQLAIRKLCDNFSIPVHFVYGQQKMPGVNLARDLQHPGTKYQQSIAQQFITLIENDKRNKIQ